MSDKDTEGTLQSWLFRTTGAAWILAAQVLGVAVLAIAEQHIPKKGLLTVIGAQVLLLAVAILIARRQAKLAKKRESGLTDEIDSLRRDLDAARSQPVSEPTPDEPLNKHEVRVLDFLSNKSSGAWAAHVGHCLDLTIAEVEFCFDGLKDRGMIKQVRADKGSGAEYGVTSVGRAYLFKQTNAQQGSAPNRRPAAS